MRILSSLAVGCILLSISLSGMAAVAAECVNEQGIVRQRHGECVVETKGGGGEVPVPFGLNQKAELATDELYVLMGKILIYSQKGMEPRAFFQIDLQDHPWLASEKRINYPYYPIEGSAYTWKSYAGRKVKLMARAHGKIVTVSGKLEYVIFLEPIQSPERSRVRD